MLWAVTVAPLTAPPDTSVMVPAIVPLLVCATEILGTRESARSPIKRQVLRNQVRIHFLLRITQTKIRFCYPGYSNMRTNFIPSFLLDPKAFRNRLDRENRDWRGHPDGIALT